MTVIGVVKDCAYKSPTAELPNTVFVNTDQMKWMHARCFVLFKYRPGTWDECRRRIEEMQRAELPDRKLFLYSEEERYNDYLKSEDALSSLLGFSSLVCIFISIFGIYSLVTLACERRRKEIAIRKVNGATGEAYPYAVFQRICFAAGRFFAGCLPSCLVGDETLDRAL